jgi:hypothetical protein
VVNKAYASWAVKEASKEQALHQCQKQQQQQQQWTLCRQNRQLGWRQRACLLYRLLLFIVCTLYYLLLFILCCSGCSGAEQGRQQAADNPGQPAWGAQAGEGGDQG